MLGPFLKLTPVVTYLYAFIVLEELEDAKVFFSALRVFAPTIPSATSPLLL